MPSYTSPSSDRIMRKHQKGQYTENTRHVTGSDYSREFSSVYGGSRLPAAPQTPFDTSYGASLLPSHLLMSSPFLATPGVGHSSPHRHVTNKSSQAYKSTQLRMPPSDAIRGSRRHNKEKHLYDEGTRQIPYKLTFNILPRNGNGDGDKFRTRSLYFSNLNPDIRLHEFLATFHKFDRIESVYVVDREQQSVLVSFLTKETCLDFYNGILQKLSEFKKELRSKELSLSFASPQKVESGPTLQEIKFEVLRAGATRSLGLEFKDEIDFASLLKKFDFFDNSGPRYVIESIEIVNTDKPSKYFGSNYAIVHFISIAMAVETMEYWKAQTPESFGLTKVSYVNSTFTSGKSEFQTFSNSELSDQNDVEVQDSISSFEDITLSEGSVSVENEKAFTVLPSQYGPPVVEEHNQHCSHITISKALSSKVSRNGSSSSIASPQPQEVLVSNSEAPSSRNSIVSLLSARSQGPTYPVPGYHYYMDMSKPLGQTLQQQYTATAQVATAMGGGAGNRTVYIGNISPRSKTEDICNVVRGGILQSVKYIEAKHICFVTFIEAASAVQFFANSSIEPIVLHGSLLKVGWGHHSGNLPQSISLAVTIGASRNVYVSLPEYAFKDKFIKDPEYQAFREKFKLPSKQQLYDDFSTFGDIELINFLEDGHCCWINFMNISNAIKLVEDANNSNNESFHEKFENRYRGLFIGYGKDRCGNVNKNLVSNKNSKYFKKVKKASYNIRLRRQQKSDIEAQAKSGKGDENSEKKLQVDAFGISVGSQPDARYSDEEQKIEENELLLLSKPNSAEGGLGISVSQDVTVTENNTACDGKNKTGSVSSGSSEVDILVSAPGSANTSQLESGGPTQRTTAASNGKKERSSGVSKLHCFSEIAPRVSKASLDAVPPLAPAALNCHYNSASRRSARKNGHDHDSNPVSGSKSDIGSKSTQGKSSKSRQRNAQAIPGSNVMAQYLAQLQHSTFMYAADILGVDDPNLHSTL